MLNEIKLIHSPPIAESIEYRLLLTTLRLLLLVSKSEEPGIIEEPFVMETWLISVVLPVPLPVSSSSSITSRPVAPRTELNSDDEWREQSLTPLSLLSVYERQLTLRSNPVATDDAAVVVSGLLGLTGRLGLRLRAMPPEVLTTGKLGLRCRAVGSLLLLLRL